MLGYESILTQCAPKTRWPENGFIEKILFPKTLVDARYVVGIFRSGSSPYVTLRPTSPTLGSARGVGQGVLKSLRPSDRTLAFHPHGLGRRLCLGSPRRCGLLKEWTSPRSKISSKLEQIHKISSFTLENHKKYIYLPHLCQWE